MPQTTKLKLNQNFKPKFKVPLIVENQYGIASRYKKINNKNQQKKIEKQNRTINQSPKQIKIANHKELQHFYKGSSLNKVKSLTNLQYSSQPYKYNDKNNVLRKANRPTLSFQKNNCFQNNYFMLTHKNAAKQLKNKLKKSQSMKNLLEQNYLSQKAKQNLFLKRNQVSTKSKNNNDQNRIVEYDRTKYEWKSKSKSKQKNSNIYQSQQKLSLCLSLSQKPNRKYLVLNKNRQTEKNEPYQFKQNSIENQYQDNLMYTFGSRKS